LISIPRSDDPSRQWSWRSIRARLNTVRADPQAAVDAARAARALGGIGVALGPPPLELELDMPTGAGPTAGPPPPGHTVTVPPLDGLTHTAAWLRTIHGRGFHGGVLDGLAAYYGTS
jgi:hypothetical protein